MKKFSEFIAEASNHDNINTASKLRNHMVKHFGAEPTKNWNGSNPYSDTQDLQGHFTSTKHANAAVQHLKDHGWTEGPSSHFIKGKEPHYLFHPTHKKVHILIAKEPYGNTVTSKKLAKYHSFTAVGPKKAKRSNIPYYD